jgi:uncharacterized protein YecT (DUF1311 family)
MIGLRALIICSLAMSFTGPALAAKSGEAKDSLLRACIKKADGVDIAIAECNGAETDRQDKLLNAAYRELLARSSPDDKVLLIKAERAWVAFRDAECDYEYSITGGTLAHVTGTACMLDMTKKRIEDLDNSLSTAYLNGQ